MPKRQRQKLSHFLGLTVGLFLIWTLLSGKFEMRFLLIGILSSMAVSYVCIPFLTIKNVKNDKEFFIFSIHYPKFFLYSFWLLKQIFSCSLMVAKEILKFHIAYEPKIIYFSMPFENPVASTTLANSIVLTPGILTLDVERDGSYQVHALNDALANFMLEGEMCRRVAMLFDEPCQFSAISKDEVGFAFKEKG